MKIETIYYPSDLESGKCESCEEKSDEILIGDGRCVECIQADEFERLSIEEMDRDSLSKQMPY